jgi:hypothetical protein
MTDLPEQYRYLLSDDVRKRQSALRAHSRQPSGDARVLPYLEAMLEDRRLCIVSLPFEFGEVRWLAAEAVAAERKVLGIPTPVRLVQVVLPVSHKKLQRIAESVGAPRNEGWQERFERLRAMGALELVDLDLEPQFFGL